MKKIITADEITKAVTELCINANYHLPEKTLILIKKALKEEESAVAQKVLQNIIDNAEIASEGTYPLCQDTGIAVFFVEQGQDVSVEPGTIYEAITKGVHDGYIKGYLRFSLVSDPLRRENTGDNTPPVIWLETVPGDQLKITLAPKGGGSENMSALIMLTPSQGQQGVIDFVVNVIDRAGGKPCPPLIIGVGIGGTFEKCAWLAKKALLRPAGKHHNDTFYARMEMQLLKRINDLGIGPMGLGGRTTALAVHIETFPCHIASLPVAVNIQCHSARHKQIIL